MKLRLREKLFFTYMFLAGAWCGCSRTTDSTSVRRTVFEEGIDASVTAEASGGSKEVDTQAPSSTLEIGAFDELKFAEDTVLAADGGPEEPDGGPARVTGVVHHPPVKLTQTGAATRTLEAWQATKMGADEHVGIKLDDAQASKKKTSIGVLKGPLTWLGALVLVAGLLVAVYRSRSWLKQFIPFLRFLP